MFDVDEKLIAVANTLQEQINMLEKRIKKLEENYE